RGVGLAQPREDLLQAVAVRRLVEVGDRVGGDRDVIAVFMGGAGGGLDADAGGDARQHDLGDTAAAQLQIQAGAVEGAPVLLADGDVGGLPVEFGDELGPVGGRRGPA